MITNFNGIFAGIFNNKKDQRLKNWLNHADFQLKLKSCNKCAPHITAEDVILDIITGVLTGKITWDMDRVPNVSTFMINQIRSYVSNLQKKEFNRLSIYNSYSDCLPQSFKHDSEDVPGISLREIMKEQDIVELIDIICRLLEDDIVAYYIFLEIVKGAKNRQMAASLELDLKEVLSGKRRIRRVLRRIKHGLE